MNSAAKIGVVLIVIVVIGIIAWVSINASSSRSPTTSASINGIGQHAANSTPYLTEQQIVPLFIGLVEAQANATSQYNATNVSYYQVKLANSSMLNSLNSDTTPSYNATSYWILEYVSRVPQAGLHEYVYKTGNSEIIYNYNFNSAINQGFNVSNGTENGLVYSYFYYAAQGDKLPVEVNIWGYKDGYYISVTATSLWIDNVSLPEAGAVATAISSSLP